MSSRRDWRRRLGGREAKYPLFQTFLFDSHSSSSLCPRAAMKMPQSGGPVGLWACGPGAAAWRPLDGGCSLAVPACTSRCLFQHVREAETGETASTRLFVFASCRSVYSTARVPCALSPKCQRSASSMASPAAARRQRAHRGRCT